MAESEVTEPVDPPKETPPKETPPKETEPPKEPTNSVAEEVKKALAELGIKPGGQSPPLGRRVDIESMAEQMVRDASVKLEKEKEQETRISKLEADVKSKVEETPRKARKLTKALWGDEK